MRVMVFSLLLLMPIVSFSQESINYQSLEAEVKRASKGMPNLYVEIDLVSDNKVPPTITVYTNLPDGYELAVSIINKKLMPAYVFGRYGVAVKDGKFTIGPITYRQTDTLDKGVYEVIIESWGDGTKYPFSAQKIAGWKNEKLQGDHVDYVLTYPELWKEVYYRGTFVVD